MRFLPEEKKTFRLLLIAGILNGFVFSAFQLQDVIAKKALHAYDWQITLLVMLWPLSNLFSIWWGKILEHSKTISKYFVLTAFAGRLILLFMLFVKNYYHYLSILVILFSFNALISPAQNSIFQRNFQPKNRGFSFGLISSLTTLMLIVSSFIAGRMLDSNENWFRYFFALVGCIGCVSSLIMSMVKIDKKGQYRKDPLTIKQLVYQPIKRTIEVLKKNHHFALFQRNYFVYGAAYMILLPAIPKYLVEYLNMSYTETFLGKAVISQVGILLLAPFAGTIHDKKNPAYFTFQAFAMLSLYPLIFYISSFFIGTSFVNYLVYFGFFVFGIAMSAIMISWNISSICFAGDEDVSMYQSVHVTLTGLRGLIMPGIGFFLLKFFGIRTVFFSAFIIFLLASALSYQLYLKMDKKVFAKKIEIMKLIFRKIVPFV